MATIPLTDNHTIFRQGLHLLLEKEKDLEVILLASPILTNTFRQGPRRGLVWPRIHQAQMDHSNLGFLKPNRLKYSSGINSGFL